MDERRNYNGKLSNDYSYGTYSILESLKKNLNTSSSLDLLSIPQSGGKIMSKRIVRWDHRLQRQKSLPRLNGFFPDGSNMSGRSPPLYCTLTLITPRRDDKQNKTETMY